MNKTFCTLPFLEYFRKNGQHQLCCIAPTVIKHTPGGDDSAIMDFMNSPEMKEVRRKMANGQEVSACDVCYKSEEITGQSKRTSRNKQFTDQAYIDSIISNDMELPGIKNLNFRPDRLCNLQCKMCGNWSSSQIVKEERRIIDNGDQEYFDTMGFTIPAPYQADDNSEILKDIDKVLPGLELMEFAGGEPTLIPEVSEIMQKCIDLDYAKNIFIKMPINVTNVTDKFIKQLSHFKLVQLDCSIDGVGAVQEYIRYPSNWETIASNFEKLMATDYNVKVLHTVQNLNVMEIDKMVEWSVGLVIKHNKGKYQPFYVNMVTLPEYLYCGFMPDNLIEQGLESITRALEYVENSAMIDFHKKVYVDQLSVITRHLEHSLGGDNNPHHFNQLKYYLRYQDITRGQNIHQLVPGIGDWLDG